MYLVFLSFRAIELLLSLCSLLNWLVHSYTNLSRFQKSKELKIINWQVTRKLMEKLQLCKQLKNMSSALSEGSIPEWSRILIPSRHSAQFRKVSNAWVLEWDYLLVQLSGWLWCLECMALVFILQKLHM